MIFNLFITVMACADHNLEDRMYQVKSLDINSKNLTIVWVVLSGKWRLSREEYRTFQRVKNSFETHLLPIRNKLDKVNDREVLLQMALFVNDGETGKFMNIIMRKEFNYLESIRSDFAEHYIEWKKNQKDWNLFLSMIATIDDILSYKKTVVPFPM